MLFLIFVIYLNRTLPGALILKHFLLRMQGVDTENFQRANQRSTALFKKLKDHCRGKRCHGKVKVQKEVVVEQEGGASEYRNLKVRTLSRSAQLIENSKIVKMQRKSEDEIKEKDTELETGKKTENENEELDDDGNVFHDILKDGQGKQLNFN